MTATRLQWSRVKGWQKPRGTVYVGRPSRWGNPFPVAAPTAEAHAVAVALYREWLYAPELAGLREAARRLLVGKSLACWCPPGLPCHADVLLELVNG